MVQNLVSPEYYANLVQQHGKAGADAILRKEGWRVDVPEPDFTPVGAPIAPASPTGGLGGGTGMDGDDDNEGQGEDALPVGGLRYADVQKEADAANKGLYGQMQSHIGVLDAAREALRNRRLGPSNSEKWLAIAAALGQPTRTGAFGESVGNLAQALAAQKAELRKDQREADLLGLKYGLEAGTERIRLAQARATEADRTLRAVTSAAAAARKAMEPRYERNLAGEVKEIPRYVAKPRTRQDYEALPVGTYYMVPSGPDKGKIVTKDPDGKFGG